MPLNLTGCTFNSAFFPGHPFTRPASFGCLGFSHNTFILVSVLHKQWCVSCSPFLSGLVIYFGYGIHHSAEAAAARSSPDTVMNGFKRDHELEDMSPEKEAFLPYDIDAREEDDGDL